MLPSEKYILYLRVADLATHSVYDQVSFYSVFLVNVTGSGLGISTIHACSYTEELESLLLTNYIVALLPYLDTTTEQNR